MRARVPRSTLCLGAALLALLSFHSDADAAPALSDSFKTAALADIDSLRLDYQARSALAAIEPFVPLARAEEDSSFLFELLVRQGLLQASIGMYIQSEPHLREALALAEARSDSVGLCRTIRWLSVAVGNQGRSSEARVLNEHLLAMASALGDDHHQAWALVGLAWAESLKGESGEAARNYRRAVTHFEKGGDLPGEAWARNGLGTALSDLGDYRDALACFEVAATLAREDGNGSIEAMALNNLGALAFSLGDPGAALDHFHRALELTDTIGDLRRTFTPALNIAICQTHLGRYLDAEASLVELLANCHSQGYADFEALTQNQQAILNGIQGRFHRAAALYRRSLELDESLPFKNRVEALIGLSNALAAMDSSAAALSVLMESRDLLNESGDLAARLYFRIELGRKLGKMGRHAEALEQFILVDGETERLGLSGSRLSALGEAARCQRALGRPDSSLVLLERAVELWERERGLPLDPEWREQRGAAGRQLYTELARLLLDPASGRPEVERSRAAFDQLQVFKARTLLERMLGPGSVAAADALTPITLAELQWEILRDDELLLDVYLGPETSWLFAVTRDVCRALPLPPEPELEERLQYYFRFLSTPPEAESRPGEGSLLRSAAGGLHRLLFAELGDLLAGAELVFFAPDGSLNLLPLSSLSSGDGGEEPGPGPHWARIPSATVLARLRQRPEAKASGPAGILALAGRRTASGEALPGAIREVRSLRRRYGGVDLRIMPAEPAGEEDGIAVEGLSGYKLLHLAAHASVDDQYPWQSAIQLSPGTRRGRLSATQIAASRLSARLAVLAGCESAGGRVLSGEGVLGLSSAFLSAGVPAVLATLWPVDDRATAKFMESFYRGLAEGLNAAAALRRAQASLRGDAITAAPFFWAGFVLVGDGEIRVPLESRRSSLWLLALGLAALGGAALLTWETRRRRRKRRRPKVLSAVP